MATSPMTETEQTLATDVAMDSPATRRAVGFLVRKARESHGLTQEQLATMTLGKPWQVSRAAISAVERGRNLPNLAALVAFRRILHLDPLEILELTEHRAPYSVEPGSDSFHRLSERAERLLGAGDARAAVAVYDVILERLPLDDGTLRARLDLSRATAFLVCGALQAARSGAERVLTLASDDASLRAEAYALLAELHIRMGHLPLAENMAARAVELASACDARVQTLAFSAEAMCLLQGERFGDAISAFARARDRAREAREHFHLGHATGSMGLCCSRLGQRRQARRLFEDALALARKHAQPPLEARWLVELGYLALEEDRPTEADRFAAAALAIAKPSGHASMVLRAEWLRHLVFKLKNPEREDRHRLGQIRKLLARIPPGDRDHLIQDVERS